MPPSAFEPLDIPAALWLRGDVGQALDRRDIGALLRLIRQHTGASQTRLGTAIGLAQGTVSLYMTGNRTVITIDLLERIAGGLHMPDPARLRLGLAPRQAQRPQSETRPPPVTEEHTATDRRAVVHLGLAAALSPQTLRAVLHEAAAEAMEFTRAAGASALGVGTFDHLDAVIADLDRAYSREPPAERFAVARSYRHRVEQLLNGRRTLKQARELYVYAAWLSEILAWLAHDLGAPLAAEAYAIDSFEHADQAGHDELCAWAADAMATIAMYTDRPDRAIAVASRGLVKAPPRHPVTVRLHAQAARAHAKLGHAEPSRTLLRKAQDLHDRLPARTPARLSHDTGALATFAMTAYAASSHLWLADYPQAEALARTAITTHETAPTANQAPSREAIARLDLGIALAHQGQIDEAIAAGHQALDCARLVNSVLTRAGELDTVLIGRYLTLSDVSGFHARYRGLVKAAQHS